jgi:AraC family transcriptional regulator
LAKIAVELEQAVAKRDKDGASGEVHSRVLAEGDGWAVADMVCTSGPRDRRFEEQHSMVSIAIVAAGSFEYRSACGCELMTPGSLLLGNPGQSYECGHEHGEGDRCVSFWYAPNYFETLTGGASFRMLRIPPVVELSPLVAQACSGLDSSSAIAWEELSVRLASQTLQLANGSPAEPTGAAPSAVARVTRIIRTIERDPDAPLQLASLAREAGLSPYHFLRIFQLLTGLTPHRYVLRSRLREAALRLRSEPARILDIALDCGFGDVSNFNRAFRSEFGTSPRAYRKLES